MHFNFGIFFPQGVLERSKLFYSTHLSLELVETVCQWFKRIDVTLRQEVMYERRELACIRADVENGVDIEIAQPPEPVLGNALRFDSQIREGAFDKTFNHARCP